MTDVKELRDSLEKQLKDGFAGLQQKYDKASEAIQKGETVTAEMKTAIENQKGELQKLVDKVLEMEEKGVQLRGRQPEKKGFIDFVNDHGEYKALRENGKSVAEIEVSKGDLAAMQETKVTSAGLVVPQFDPTIQANPRQELRIRDLIPSVPVIRQRAALGDRAQRRAKA